ncbi:hypothetical protein ABVT39_020983 [Epinephelus coioides]
MEGPANNPNKRKKTDSAIDTQDLLSSEFSVLESINRKLEVLGTLHQEIKDLKSRSMRDNLIISGILESTPDNPEVQVKKFMVTALKIPTETVNNSRVHRLGASPNSNIISRKCLLRVKDES